MIEASQNDHDHKISSQKPTSKRRHSFHFITSLYEQTFFLVARYLKHEKGKKNPSRLWSASHAQVFGPIINVRRFFLSQQALLFSIRLARLKGRKEACIFPPMGADRPCHSNLDSVRCCGVLYQYH